MLLDEIELPKTGPGPFDAEWAGEDEEPDLDEDIKNLLERKGIFDGFSFTERGPVPEKGFTSSDTGVGLWFRGTFGDEVDFSMTVQKHDTKGFELYLVFQKLRGDVELRSDFETQAMSDDIDDLAVIIVNKATFRALMSQFNDTVQKRASQIMSNN